ncbi:MAG: hypothetical protein A2X64_06820 [Ignavibacteria bacterium GWF2_33_9]|nr:MAG: hypothetical protein A2X64_06820 [Ignavibacteria bacterium GWF2_33_9]
MKKNIGKVDKFIRLFLGVIFLIISYAYGFAGTTGIIFLILGLLLVLTSATSFCPLYSILRMNTNKE